MARQSRAERRRVAREAKRAAQQPAPQPTAEPAALAEARRHLESARRRAESLLAGYPSLWWDSPRFFPGDFDRGGYPFPHRGYGHGHPYGDRRHDRTHAPLPYLTEEDWFAHVSMSRELLTCNPFGVGFLRHVRAFLIGNGVTVSFVLKGQAPGPSASGPVDADGDGAPDVAQEVKWASAAYEEWAEENDWGQGSQDRQLESADRWLSEGESNLRHFPGGRRAVPRLRHVEPEHVRTPLGKSLADPEGWGVETAPADAETERALHVNYEPEWDDWERVTLYSRVKWGVARSVKRGVSIMLPSGEHLRRTQELFANMAHVARVQAAVAWVEKYGPAATQDQVRNLIEAGQDYSGVKYSPYGGTSEVPVNTTLPGTVKHVEQGREFTPGPTSSPGGFLEISRAVLGGVAFSLGLPESFTPGGGADSFASVLVTGSPFVRAIEEMQKRFAGFVRDVVVKVLELCEESGRIPAGVARAVKPVVTCSPVVIADEEKQARTFLSLVQAGAADPYKGMQELGYEPKTSLANLADWKRKLRVMDASQQPQGGGGGGWVEVHGRNGTYYRRGSQGGGGPPPGPTPAPPGSAGGDGSSPNNPFGEGVVREAEGEPPFPGAVFDRGKHRWVNPNKGDGAAGKGEPKPGRKVHRAAAEVVDTVKDLVQDRGAVLSDRDEENLVAHFAAQPAAVRAAVARELGMKSTDPEGMAREVVDGDVPTAIMKELEDEIEDVGDTIQGLYNDRDGAFSDVDRRNILEYLSSRSAQVLKGVADYFGIPAGTPEEMTDEITKTPKSESRVREGAPPGPAPRPGLVWNDSTHRWRNPETGDERPHEPAEALAGMVATAPDAETRDYLESALHNVSDGTPEDVVGQLAAVWRHAFDRGRGEVAAHLAGAVARLGGEVRGGPGAQAEFDPLAMASDSPLSTGQRVRVSRPAVLLGGKVLLKAAVEPA